MASVCLDPIVRSARPSIRVDQLINHKLLHTSSDAEAVRTKRTNLLLDSHTGCQALTRSLPRPGTLVFHLRTNNLPLSRSALSSSLAFPSRGLTHLARPAFDLLTFFFGSSTSTVVGTS